MTFTWVLNKMMGYGVLCKCPTVSILKELHWAHWADSPWHVGTEVMQGPAAFLPKEQFYLNTPRPRFLNKKWDLFVFYLLINLCWQHSIADLGMTHMFNMPPLSAWEGSLNFKNMISKDEISEIRLVKLNFLWFIKQRSNLFSLLSSITIHHIYCIDISALMAIN